MAQRIDMRADMQRQHHGILGKLEAARPARAGGVVPAVASHEMLHAGPVLRHGCAWRQRLRQAQHLARPDQRRRIAYLCRGDVVQRPAFIVFAPATPRLARHDALSRDRDAAICFSSRRISLPVTVTGNASRTSMKSGTL